MRIKSIVILLFLLSNYAYGQYQIQASVFGNGGGVISNSNFRIYLTAGQVLIGQLQGGNFRMQVGFWRPAQLLTPVQELLDLTPTEYRLDQNYPNPFNPTTTIRFALPKNSKVTLKLFDIIGREVVRLVDDELPPGEYKVVFEAANLSSGLYFYRLETQDFVRTRKLTLLK